jgi:hypothetical protein
VVQASQLRSALGAGLLTPPLGRPQVSCLWLIRVPAKLKVSYRLGAWRPSVVERRGQETRAERGGVRSQETHAER